MESISFIQDITNSFTFVAPIIIKLFFSLIIVFIGFIVGRIVQKVLLKLFDMTELDEIIAKKLGFKDSLAKIIATACSYLVYLLAIVYALARLSIATTVITTIIIALSILVVLFFLFGLNDFFSNLFAGLLVSFRNNLRVGDCISIKEQRLVGKIVKMTLIYIQVETGRDETVFIPNRVLLKSQVSKKKK